MTFIYDPAAALARIRSQTYDPAKVAKPAKVGAPGEATLATFATLADADPHFRGEPPVHDLDPQDLLDHYEERSAIFEYDAGRTREAAEAAALVEVARSVGLTPTALRRLWADRGITASGGGDD